MSTSSIQGLNGNQNIAPNDTINASVEVKSKNTTNVQKNINNIKTLNDNTNAHIQKVLTKAYRLSETDAKNIQSFTDALGQHIDKQIEKQSTSGTAQSWDGGGGAGILEDIKKERNASKKLKGNIAKNTNITAGFFTKLKSLCAKIASFFGDNSKIEKLQSEGLAQFKELKNLLTTSTRGRAFLASFIEKNSDNKEAMAGMFKIVFGQEYKDAQSNVLNNILKENPDVKTKLLNLMINCNSTENQLEKAKIIKEAILSTIGEIKIDETVEGKHKIISLMSDIINNCSIVKYDSAVEKQDYYTGRFIAELTSRYKDLLGNIVNASNAGNQKKLNYIINELNKIKNKHDISFALFDKVSPQNYGEGMKSLSIRELVAAATKSLGEEKFLSTFKSEILDGSLKLRDKNLFLNESFVKSIDLNNKQEVVGFVKAWLWADQAMVQESLREHLSKENDSNFGLGNQISRDVERGFAFIFKINGQEIKLNENHDDLKNAESVLDEQLKNFSKDDQDKIKSFCKNFASQSYFSCSYNDNTQLHIEGNVHPTFTVEFKNNGDTSVSVKAAGELPKNPNPITGKVPGMAPNEMPDIAINASQYNPSVTTDCEFNFTFKGGIEACKGSASNVEVTKWEQNITFKE